MSLESIIRKIVKNDIVETNVYIDCKKNLSIDNEPESNADIVETVELFNTLILSCYIQPEVLQSAAQAKSCSGRSIAIYSDEHAVEKLKIIYNYSGISIDNLGRKTEFYGLNLGKYKLNFEKDIVFEIDYACQQDVCIEDSKEIKLFAFGGQYNYGDHPALIEQKLFVINEQNGLPQVKTSKISDWKNRGITFSERRVFIPNLNKELFLNNELPDVLKMNLAEIINAGMIQFKLNDIIFKSRYFKHFSGTNYIDIIFGRYMVIDK